MQMIEEKEKNEEENGEPESDSDQSEVSCLLSVTQQLYQVQSVYRLS